jgi:hypothetical protein
MYCYMYAFIMNMYMIEACMTKLKKFPQDSIAKNASVSKTFRYHDLLKNTKKLLDRETLSVRSMVEDEKNSFLHM